MNDRTNQTDQQLTTLLLCKESDEGNYPQGIFYLFVKAILCVWYTACVQKMGPIVLSVNSRKAVNEGL